jgi:hypothetical protein
MGHTSCLVGGPALQHVFRAEVGQVRVVHLSATDSQYSQEEEVGYQRYRNEGHWEVQPDELVGVLQ